MADPWNWYPGGPVPNPTPPYRRPGEPVGPEPPIGRQPSPTVLSPPQEQAYQAWRAKLPQPLQFEGNYDLRGFYQQNPTFTAKPGQHMTDEFKLPNHPTFSNESRYYTPDTAHLGGHWDGNVFVPNDTRYKQPVDETPPKTKRSSKRARLKDYVD